VESQGDHEAIQARLEDSRLVCSKLWLRYLIDTTVEWFGIYKVGQRVAKRFSDEAAQVFIAGDVCFRTW
jgi:hypothetical protein